MHRAYRTLLAAAISALGVSACTGILGGGGPAEGGPRGPQECPEFALQEDTISVGSAGGEFDLGNDNRLVFARGAVTGGRASYAVRRLPEQQGRRLAGIEIEPLNGAPDLFEEPVMLRISYDGCPFENSRRPMWLVKDRSGSWERIGGAKSAVGRYVEAAVNEFSGFAIAM
jgi:hypothetical protein